MLCCLFCCLFVDGKKRNAQYTGHCSFSRVPYELVKQQQQQLLLLLLLLQTGSYSTRHALTSIPMVVITFPKGGMAMQTLDFVTSPELSLHSYCTKACKVNFKMIIYINKTATNSNEVVNLAIGGFAGGMESWATTLIAVIKTRLHTNLDFYQESLKACTRAIWEVDGAAAFMRGAIPRLNHKAPANAVFLMWQLFRHSLYSMTFCFRFAGTICILYSILKIIPVSAVWFVIK